LGLYLKSIENMGLPLGLMVTASHNKYKDNGFKIAAFKGESAPLSWEEFFEDLVNTNNITTKLKEILEKISLDKNISLENLLAIKANICVGYDTRPSSIIFYEIIK
jgi:phosphomannomutase